MSVTHNDLLNLNGKTAVVTGGTDGIGSAICQTLSRSAPTDKLF